MTGPSQASPRLQSWEYVKDNERKVQEFVKRISNLNKRQAEFLNECGSRRFEASQRRKYV